MIVTITLTLASVGTGPFDLYSDVDGYTVPFETGVSKTSLLTGYTTSLVPNGATVIRVKSIGICTNYIDLTIVSCTVPMRFIAGGVGTNNLAYSNDGITWTGNNTSYLSTIFAVQSNGYSYIAGGTSGSTSQTIIYSTDGISWTPANNSLIQNTFDLFWDGIKYFAAGNMASAGDPAVMYSTDGLNWNFSNIQNVVTADKIVNVRTIYYCDNTWLIGTTKPPQGSINSLLIQRSTDGGYNFSADTNIDLIFTGLGGNSITSIVSDGNIWLAGGAFFPSPYQLVYSYDTLTWSGLSINPSFFSGSPICWDIEYNGNVFVAAFRNDNNTKILYSSDGLSWNQSNTGTLFTGVNDAISLNWNGNILSVGGEGGNTIGYSTDGINWSASTNGGSIISTRVWSIATNYQPLVCVNISPCSVVPTPTNTQTLTVTPTNTPTLTKTPTETPTQTPTPTNCTGQFSLVNCTYDTDISGMEIGNAVVVLTSGSWPSTPTPPVTLYGTTNPVITMPGTYDVRFISLTSYAPYPEDITIIDSLGAYHTVTVPAYYGSGDITITDVYIDCITPIQIIVGYPCELPLTLTSSDILTIDDTTDYIYKYNPSSNQITYLFSGTTTYSDIAATTNKIFINSPTSGDIEQFTYTGSPSFNVVYNTTYTSLPDGSGLFAKDNNYVYVASNDVNLINLSAGTYTTLFSLSGLCDSGVCVTTGDIIWNSTKNEFGITWSDNSTFDYGVALLDSTGGTIYNMSLSGFSSTTYPNLESCYGIFAHNNKIWIATELYYLYEVDFVGSSLNGPVVPNNLTTQKIAGANNATQNVDWTY